jgi:hypothetical protein
MVTAAIMRARRPLRSLGSAGLVRDRDLVLDGLVDDLMPDGLVDVADATRVAPGSRSDGRWGGSNEPRSRSKLRDRSTSVPSWSGFGFDHCCMLTHRTALLCLRAARRTRRSCRRTASTAGAASPIACPALLGSLPAWARRRGRRAVGRGLMPFSAELRLDGLVEVVAEASDPSGGNRPVERSPETVIGPVSGSADLHESFASQHSISAQRAHDILDLRLLAAVGPRRH